VSVAVLKALRPARQRPTAGSVLINLVEREAGTARADQPVGRRVAAADAFAS